MKIFQGCTQDFWKGVSTKVSSSGSETTAYSVLPLCKNAEHVLSRALGSQGTIRVLAFRDLD